MLRTLAITAPCIAAVCISKTALTGPDFCDQYSSNLTCHLDNNCVWVDPPAPMPKVVVGKCKAYIKSETSKCIQYHSKLTCHLDPSTCYWVEEKINELPEPVSSKAPAPRLYSSKGKCVRVHEGIQQDCNAYHSKFSCHLEKASCKWIEDFEPTVPEISHHCVQKKGDYWVDECKRIYVESLCLVDSRCEWREYIPGYCKAKEGTGSHNLCSKISYKTICNYDTKCEWVDENDNPEKPTTVATTTATTTEQITTTEQNTATEEPTTKDITTEFRSTSASSTTTTITESTASPLIPSTRQSDITVSTSPAAASTTDSTSAEPSTTASTSIPTSSPVDTTTVATTTTMTSEDPVLC